MKKTAVTLAIFAGCLILIAVGYTLGSNAVTTQQEELDSLVLLERLEHPFVVAHSHPQSCTVEDLIAVWNALYTLDRIVDAHVRQRNFVSRLREGLLWRKRNPERLAASFFGALDARSMSIVDYFRMQDSLQSVLEQHKVDSKIAQYLNRLEYRREFVKTLEAVHESQLSQLVSQEAELLMPELLNTLTNKYVFIADTDDHFLFELAKVSLAKGKDVLP